MADEVTYHLSSIDQSIIRTYVRYALCFPCDDDASSRAAVAGSLLLSLKRAVSYMPILAGKVYSVSAEPTALTRWRRSHSISSADENQVGKVEIRVSLTDIKEFQATLQAVEPAAFPYSYESLAEQNMPATAFVDLAAAITPLPDMPSGEGAPVFACQANFIEGGVIVALYLHHSAGDLQALAAAIRHMSISEDVHPTRKVTYELLLEDSMLQTAMRKQLRDSMGVPADLNEHPEYNNQVSDTTQFVEANKAPSHGAARIFSFNIKLINETRKLVNERFHHQNNMPNVKLSNFDIFTAILWKTITRNRWPLHSFAPGATSTLIFPVNIRKRMNPALPDDYYGNAVMFATTSKSIAQLSVPIDIGSLAETAYAIRQANTAMNDRKVRSGIAIIEEREDVRTLNHPNIDFAHDLFLTNWQALPTGDESGLGLGLGQPQYARKPSRAHSGYGVVMLPPKDGEYPVLMQLTADAMQRLCNDSSLMRFVTSVA